MAKDVLFLLPPGFADNGRREFCPECAETWGLLGYFPAIKDALDICHVDVTQPRAPIAALLGDGDFNAPTLVLAEGTDMPAGISFKTTNGRKYIDSIRGIAALFAARYGTPARRGS
ncbi:MAG: DUF3088 family protein [Pseudomonadota bacterium]